MSKVLRSTCAVALGIVAALLVACGGDEQEEGSGGASAASGEGGPPPALRFANPSLASDVLVHFAKGSGYFEEAGVDVEIQENTAANTSSLVVSGQADIAIFAAITPVIVAGQGKPTSVVYGLAGGGLGGSIFGKPGIDEVEQLRSQKDCRIATFPPGTSAYGYAAFYNEELDLGCELVPLQDPPAQLGALSAGRVDAIVGAYGNWAAAVNDEKLSVLADMREEAERKRYLGEPFPEVTLWGLSDNLESKREAVEAFLEGVDRALATVRDSSTEEIAAVLKEFPVFGELPDAALATTIESQLPHLTLGSDEGFIRPEQWSLGLERYALWGVEGYSPDGPRTAYEERIDMSYYEAAIGQPGGE